MKNTYLGIFFTALSTLMYEILLTRIFSVTMGYHFAFMAISIAMFGMTVGALIVFLFPQYFNQEQIGHRAALSSLLFSITIILSFLLHLYIPFVHDISFLGIMIISVTYSVVLIPFIFSGICICLILSSYVTKVGRVYAADLIGASAGCILLIFALNIAGGPTSVFVTSFFASVGALFFTLNDMKKRFVKFSLIYGLAVGLFILVHSILVVNQAPLLRINWIHGGYAENSIYEKWNSFSRVSVTGDTSGTIEPFGWGLSSVYDKNKKVKQLMLNVDAHSTTVLTGFQGDLNQLEHLKYDIANSVHYLRPSTDVLVIGTGGGRDILSSIVFKQNSVLGIEINQDMIDAVNNHFGNFTGHLDKYPNVKFVADEARSYIARYNEKFGIIQLSVIDNWSATSSGAFVLTENPLYTLESWKVLVEHLEPDGVLAVTRYYRVKPVEIYRLVALSSITLSDLGVREPGKNLIVLKNIAIDDKDNHFGTGTVLVSRSAFTNAELDTVKTLCQKMKFEIIYSPENSMDTVFSVIASGRNLGSYFANFPVDISPPTDDSPFFFYLLRFRDIFNRHLWTEWDMKFNLKAVFILFSILIVIVVLTLLCIIIPLKMKVRADAVKGSFPLLSYFGCIGLGFMLIEISQIQRLSIFLGHPTYSLSVSLFALLLSTGIGSYMTGRITSSRFLKPGRSIILLLLVLIIFGILTPHLIDAFRASETHIRILVAAALLFPIGLFMGTAFPAGVNLASLKSSSLVPWLWGINGAASVFASVLAVLIAMAFGIKAAFWTGFGFYVLAAMACFLVQKKQGVATPSF
jgi:MFS family permease